MLTALQIKNAKSKDKDYKLFDGEGMFLLVKSNGNRHWRLKYRFLGKEKLLAIGPYPLVSLQEAREAKIKAKKLLADGVDPVASKSEEKAEAVRNVQNTFQSVALEWYENRKHIWKERYAKDVLKRLEEDLFPYIGKRPIKEITQPELLEVVRKIENRGAIDLAKRQLQKSGEIFRYAISTGKAKVDITYNMHEALKPSKKSHFAAIDVSELPEFLDAVESNKARLYRNTQNALKLMLLTFVRTNELINARWEEIDFDKAEWIIPAERMKMDKSHIVPLSKQAIKILKDQKEIAEPWPLVFPSSVKPQKSISNNTILGAIKRLGFQGRMTGHGFRALAMSAIKQELHYRHEVVDRQLAHVPKSKVDRAYDRAKFLNERKVMMQDWADYIDGLRKKNRNV